MVRRRDMNASSAQTVADDRMVRRMVGAYLGCGPGGGRHRAGRTLRRTVVSPTNRPGRSAVGARDRGRGMALTHTVLIVARPAGVEFHLDHRVDAAHGQHRVVGPEGLAAWLTDAGGVPAAFRVAASCPCRPGHPGGVPGIGPDQAVQGRGPVPPDAAIATAR